MLWEVTITYRKPDLGCDHPGEVTLRQRYIAEGDTEEEAERNVLYEEPSLTGEERIAKAERIFRKSFYVESYK